MKTYLENLIRTTSTLEHERVIESETSRLRDLEKISKLRENTLFEHLVASRHLDSEKLAEIIEFSKDYNDFIGRLDDLSGSAADFVNSVIIESTIG